MKKNARISDSVNNDEVNEICKVKMQMNKGNC